MIMGIVAIYACEREEKSREGTEINRVRVRRGDWVREVDVPLITLFVHLHLRFYLSLSLIYSRQGNGGGAGPG